LEIPDELSNKITKSANKAVKKALKIAKENPENSNELRKTLKSYKKTLEKKGDLSQDEQNTLDRIKKYDLDNPDMPIKIFSTDNKDDIKDAIKFNK